MTDQVRKGGRIMTSQEFRSIFLSLSDDKKQIIIRALEQFVKAKQEEAKS